MSDNKEMITEEVSGDLSFIRSLNENKLFRNKSDLQRIDYETSRDLLFLNSLSLYILSQEAKTADWAQNTASRASTFNNFDTYKIALNDIYNLAHIHFGDTTYGDVGIEAQMRKNPVLQTMYLKFLRGIAREQNMDSTATHLFIKLEKALGIDNGVYKTIRRTAGQWNKASDKEKESTLKRLYKYTRALSPRSEFLPILKQHVGTIGALSGAQKVALGVGIFGAGIAAGYTSTREKK